MNKFYLIFLFLFFLFSTDNDAMNNAIKGNLYLWPQKAWPATKEQAERLTNVLGIEVLEKTLLVWVHAHNKECENWNLNDYAEVSSFPRNLPIFLLQDKKENDILELTIDNTPIQLRCSQSKYHGMQFQDFLHHLTKKQKNNKSVHFVIP